MNFNDEWITYTFWLGWLTAENAELFEAVPSAMDDDKKPEKSESNSADSILYEPIEKEKKKDPQPVYDPGDEVCYYDE
jgi:hypothetical protein